MPKKANIQIKKKKTYTEVQVLDVCVCVFDKIRVYVCI